MHYVGDSTFDPSIAKATYDPGAKLNWHIHPGGQVLRITERIGPLPVARSLEWCIQANALIQMRTRRFEFHLTRRS